MRSLFFESEDSIKSWLAEQGEKPFRAGQILSWLYRPGVTSFDDMKNLPASLRQKLTASFTFRTVKVADTQQSPWAVKALLRLHDSETIECVMLTDDKGRHTVCLSTQVGCAMGCRFCATGQTKSENGQCFIRNLEPDEIVEQVLIFQDILHAPNCSDGAKPHGRVEEVMPPNKLDSKMPASNQEPTLSGASSGSEASRISNIVVMGMGEPALNMDNLLLALDALSRHLDIGARKITISTVGIVSGIEQIARSGKQYHLAVSLHAPNDEIRNKIIPTNRGIGIQNILNAAENFFNVTGRRVTYEYILLQGVNDTPQCARELVQLLKKRNALVNVIPYNEVDGLPFKRPDPSRIDEFIRILENGSIQVQLRKEKGGRIDAACGQLRRKTGKISEN